MCYWIDTHAHWHCEGFSPPAPVLRAQAAINHVAICVLPAVAPDDFAAARDWAYAHADAYALGLHPLAVPTLGADALDRLAQALALGRSDPRCVAVGEIGLDYFVPQAAQPPARSAQQRWFEDQLALARAGDWPVLLHSRRAVDALTQALRRVGRQGGRRGLAWHGIAHAFNGSVQQAQALIDLGLKLGFGGAFTHTRALQLRRLAATLPLDALVLETDAPDMPPAWLALSAEQRAAGQRPASNSSAELPRIGAALAALRGLSAQTVARQTSANALAALPRLQALLDAVPQPLGATPG